MSVPLNRTRSEIPTGGGDFLSPFGGELERETASPPRATTRRQQRAFDTFRQTYNIERPHEALGQQPPARRYHASPRSYPSRVRAPEYDVEMTVRQVRTNGEIKWKGNTIYLSKSLEGEPIGARVPPSPLAAPEPGVKEVPQGVAEHV